jgi:hypothetical protein
MCSALAVGALALIGSPAHAGAKGPGCVLDVPTITCIASTPTSITLRICAGPSGAPGGISLHWTTLQNYQDNGNTFDDSFGLSLSGNCQQGAGRWDLAPGECQDLVINASTIINENATGCGASGDAGDLLCDTEYVFEIFAHNEPGPGGCNQSGKSDPVFCSTAPCPGGGDCTLSWGYWKTHGPEGCNPPGKENMWPVSSLNIGGLAMNEAQLCAVLQTNPGACAKGGTSNNGSNAVIILQHQLIGAMFNVANGAIDCGFANAAIVQANALLVGFENACVGTSTPLGQQMVELAGILGTYNSDQCSCPVQGAKPQASPSAPTNAKRSSWGSLKSIYR